MMEKVRIFNNFKYFRKHEMVLMQKVISCVIIFFMLISLINIRKIEVEIGGFVKESIKVTVKAVAWQVSFINKIYVGKIMRVFVDANEEVLIKEQRARGEAERIIVKELMVFGSRIVGEEEDRGGASSEQAGECNSLMASVGYLMVADVYEMNRYIKESDGDRERFEGKVWEKEIYIEAVKGEYLKGERISLETEEIIKEKEGSLLLAKELSMIDFRNKNIAIENKEWEKNIKGLSL